MTLNAGTQRFLRSYLSHIVVIALIVVIFLVGYSVSDRVATWRNISTMLQQLAVLGLASLGQTVVILTGGIDLSIGQLIGTGTVFFARFTELYPDYVWLAVILLLLASSLVGLLNGVLVVLLKVHPLIVTLGVSSALLGGTYLYTHEPIGAVPDSVVAVAYDNFLGVPISALFTIVVFVLTALWLRRTRSGRAIYFVGGSPESARLNGIPVGRVLAYTYTFSGLCAGLAAIFLAARTGVGDPVIGNTLTLQSITPVVVGGTLLAGGRGGVSGTILGVFMLSLMANVLNYMQVSSYTQWIIQGLVILVAVGIHKPAENHARTA